jgi:UDP-N-acetylmuramate dehydrogenase
MLSHAELTELSQALSHGGFDVRHDFPMGPLTTYAVGGNALVAVVIKDIATTIELAKIVSRYPLIPVAIVGRGSNTLVSDAGFSGLVVVISSTARDVEVVLEGDVVTADAAMTMPVLARRSVGAGRAGLEWCVGIPGSVGGAVRMNAGGHGADMADSLVSVEVVSLTSGHHVMVHAKDLGLHFRGSAVAAHHLITSASFHTTSTSVEQGTHVIDEIVRWRREHQPGGRNAGSVFVNPAPGSRSAGALIDAVGLRGYRSGGAMVSDKHANFIQADPGASADDIVNVMLHVQETVGREHLVTLRSEVCLLGFTSEVVHRFADPTHHDEQKIRARNRLCELLGESS